MPAYTCSSGVLSQLFHLLSMDCLLQFFARWWLTVGLVPRCWVSLDAGRRRCPSRVWSPCCLTFALIMLSTVWNLISHRSNYGYYMSVIWFCQDEKQELFSDSEKSWKRWRVVLQRSSSYSKMVCMIITMGSVGGEAVGGENL